MTSTITARVWVNGSNDSPVFTVDGAAAAANAVRTVSHNENLQQEITNVVADGAPVTATTEVAALSTIDPDSGATRTITIDAGYRDGALFELVDNDAGQRVLRWIAAPDWETDRSTDDTSGVDTPDNVYEVRLQVTDGTATDTITYRVTVQNVNDVRPAVTSGNAASIDENVAANDSATEQGGAETVYTAAASKDAAGPDLVYSLGGTDAGAFGIDSATGAVWFRNAPDHEDKDSYVIEVTATSGTLSSEAHTVTITINDLNDDDPVFTSGAAASAAENSVTANNHASNKACRRTTAEQCRCDTAAARPDRAADADDIVYSLAGRMPGPSGSIHRSGEVWFRQEPDHEAKDSYSIEVTATVGDRSATQTVTVSITDDPADNVTVPVFSSGTTANFAEGGTGAAYTAEVGEGEGTVRYAITGGADRALFDIDATSGAVTFKTEPDFEKRQDAGSDNVYDIVITATATSADGKNMRTATRMVPSP